MASWKMQPDILAILLVAARYYLKFRAIALTLRARLHSQPLMLVANNVFRIVPVIGHALCGGVQQVS
jgi:hypothetical protein